MITIDTIITTPLWWYVGYFQLPLVCIVAGVYLLHQPTMPGASRVILPMVLVLSLLVFLVFVPLYPESPHFRSLVSWVTQEEFLVSTWPGLVVMLASAACVPLKARRLNQSIAMLLLIFGLWVAVRMIFNDYCDALI